MAGKEQGQHQAGMLLGSSGWGSHQELSQLSAYDTDSRSGLLPSFMAAPGWIQVFQIQSRYLAKHHLVLV